MEITRSTEIKSTNEIYIGMAIGEGHTTPYSQIMYSEAQAQEYLQNKAQWEKERKVIKVENPFI